MRKDEHSHRVMNNEARKLDNVFQNDGKAGYIGRLIEDGVGNDVPQITILESKFLNSFWQFFIHSFN